MSEAPERIWAWSTRSSKKVQRNMWATAKQTRAAHAIPYVLASIADEDRRKLERLTKAAKAVGCFCEHTRVLRAALAEIEGEGKEDG